jgi:hypothetical protein
VISEWDEKLGKQRVLDEDDAKQAGQLVWISKSAPQQSRRDAGRLFRAVDFDARLLEA